MAVTLTECRLALSNELLSCSSLLRVAHTQDALGKYMFTEQQRASVVEVAFLRAYTSWEGFMENAFLSYLLGEPSRQGVVFPAHVSPTDSGHALKLVVGAGIHVSWTDPSKVVDLTRVYFRGTDPFKVPLDSAASDLRDMYTIRNAIAHSGRLAQAPLESLGHRLLAKSVPGITPAQLLLSSRRARPVFPTYFAYFVEQMTIAADSIADGV